MRNIYDPGMAGLEVVPAVEEVCLTSHEVPAQILEFIKLSKQQKSPSSSSLKTMFKEEDSLRLLPTLQEFLSTLSGSLSALRTGALFDAGDGAQFTENRDGVGAGSKLVAGAVARLEPGPPVFLAGEQVETIIYHNSSRQ